MSIAKTIEDYLRQNAVAYVVVDHSRSLTTQQTAAVAHIPAEQIAKAVILSDEDGYVMAVIPGDRHVEVKSLSRKLGRRLQLADEMRMTSVFKDCQPGAIPPIGPAYNIETVVDESLVGRQKLCFVGGDHDRLICVDGDDFVRLLEPVDYGRFSH